MAKLIRARCPSCRREMQVDPERELSTCFSCSTSSFVITTTRPLTPELAARHRWVIDARPRRRSYLVALFGVVALGVASALVILLMPTKPSPPPPGVITSSPSPRAPAPAQPVAATPPPEPVVPAPAASPPAPPPTAGGESQETTSSGGGTLPREAIARILRQRRSQFRWCYEKALKRNPKLRGTVKVRFLIGRNGRVLRAANLEKDFPDPIVVNCVLTAFRQLQFPAPEGGEVSVVYPLRFDTE